MEMLDALSGRSSAVGDDAEPVLETELIGKPGYYLEDMRHDRGIIGVYLGAGADVLSRNNEEMPRSLRVYVIKSVDEVVGVDAGGRDLPGRNLAEKTI